MTLLEMWRDTDETGVSGTGKVAEGVRLSDGTVILRWLGKVKSTVTYESFQDAKAIHGHGGKTRIFLVGNAYKRGIQDAVMDECEGVPYGSIDHSKRYTSDPPPLWGAWKAPDYIVESDRVLYLEGYRSRCVERWGVDFIEKQRAQHAKRGLDAVRAARAAGGVE